MPSTIAFVAHSAETDTLAKEMVPAGFDLRIVKAGSAEYGAALAQADFLVGYADMLVAEPLYRAGPKLKLIQLLSAGYDRADIKAAQKAGVPVANNGGANSVAVSEHAVLLMLAVSRRLIWQHGNVSTGRWRGNDARSIHELRNRTLGIVGLGTIGKKTARLGHAFGMNVLYYDIARLSEAEEDALGVRFRLFHELLREIDILSLHVPLNPSTKHLIGAAELALMHPSAILVNTSRGPVVDEAALHAALTGGKLAGAGLDVFAVEPPPADHPLLKLDNVVLTAHLAGPTQESNRARLRNAFDNVQRVARGERPLWVIPELGLSADR
jgi:phosphoglycerate dehydrogenase-like enzyme